VRRTVSHNQLSFLYGMSCLYAYYSVLV